MKIINIRKDGTEQKSMDGVVLPKELTKKVIHVLIRKEHENEKPNK